MARFVELRQQGGVVYSIGVTAMDVTVWCEEASAPF
jgi:hypothetical protein